jgi:outer membrane protein OmpA-like peptidoglycan-associated protein
VAKKERNKENIMKIKKIIILLVVVFFAGLVNHASAQLVGPVIAITGSVYDAISKNPVTALLVVTDASGKRINASRSNASENGYYFITSLKPGQKYTITVTQPNYLKEKYEMEISDAYKYTEVSHDFVLKPMEKDIKIPLAVPPFELNKSKMRYGAEQLLESIKSTLVNNPTVKFEIICYPDSDENPSDNQKITTERAQNIETYLTSAGIEKSRLSIMGSSKTDPSNPPPKKLKAKGKRYIGTTYIKIVSI